MASDFGVLGKAKVNIEANLAPLKAGMKRAFSLVKNAIKKISASVVRTAKWAALGFVAISTAAVKMAMDAEESENLFTVSMGKMAKSTRAWSEELSNALGLNAFEVRKMVSTFNVMLNSMGLSEEKAAGMSQTLTKLANDMASFYNLRVEDAFLKLQAGITGEIEPLKRLGIIIKDTTIKNKALAMGMIQEGQVLTEMQKIMLRYQLIIEQTTASQGDLQRTLSSGTNVLRSMWSQVKNVAVAFGTGLLPPVTKVGGVIRDFLVENKSMFEEWGEKVGEALTNVIGKLEKYINIFKDEGLAAAFSEAFEDIHEAMVVFWQKFKDDFMPIVADVGAALGDAFMQAWGDKLKRFAKNIPENLYRSLTPVGLAQTGVQFANQKGKQSEAQKAHNRFNERFPNYQDQVGKIR